MIKFILIWTALNAQGILLYIIIAKPVGDDIAVAVLSFGALLAVGTAFAYFVDNLKASREAREGKK